MRQNRNKTIVALNEMEAHKMVKAMRIYLGMTQAEAAKKFGLPLSVYAKYENIPGLIMKCNFLTVYRILAIMHLNPKKFLQGKYELTEIGQQITSRGTGHITHAQREILRKCRPVRLKSKD